MNQLQKPLSNTDRAFTRSWHSFGISILLLAGIMAFALLVLPPGEAGASLVRLETVLMSGLRTANDPADPIGPWWLRLVMADLTALGGRTVITLITFVAVGYLIAIKRVTTAALLAATIAGGAIANALLKEAFSRTRPDVVTHLVEAHSSSFPSAHAMNSAVIMYSNYLGQTLLQATVQTATGAQWLDYYAYVNTYSQYYNPGSDGLQVLHAGPAAVTGYDDSYPGLVDPDAHSQRRTAPGRGRHGHCNPVSRGRDKGCRHPVSTCRYRPRSIPMCTGPPQSCLGQTSRRLPNDALPPPLILYRRAFAKVEAPFFG